MFAIILDEKGYLKDYSSKYRTPESILVDAIPDEEDQEKLQCYQYKKKKFVFDAEKWAEVEVFRAKLAAEIAEAARIDGIRQEIRELKEKLDSTDYQIIKCYEYALNDLELPYDAAALHAERQTLRDQINELEATLNT